VIDRTQCAAPVEAGSGRSRNGWYGKDQHRCHRWAQIEVNGELLCRQHGLKRMI